MSEQVGEKMNEESGNTREKPRGGGEKKNPSLPRTLMQQRRIASSPMAGQQWRPWLARLIDPVSSSIAVEVDNRGRSGQTSLACLRKIRARTRKLECQVGSDSLY